MNWDDPLQRLALIERVGPEEYNRQMAAYHEASVVSRVGGHAIRPVGSRFGQLFQVGSTGKAFAELEQAEQFARDNPVQPDA
jgi:hypothetical protein